ncbi:MAG: stage V sporulation protein AB [Eubacterium sp.]|jgi:stage V sporulation protein AB|nr:stage V sporulation protein AB [Eubacterium sp.]
MLIENIVLGFFGLCFGMTVSAGVFAFITMLDIIPRLAQRTGTAAHLYGYEVAIILGGTAGNIALLFVKHFPVTQVGMGIFGLCGGIFVGCLSMALAESLRVIPIFVHRLKMREGLPLILIAFAAGKLIGTIIQYFF